MGFLSLERVTLGVMAIDKGLYFPPVNKLINILLKMRCARLALHEGSRKVHRDFVVFCSFHIENINKKSIQNTVNQTFNWLFPCMGLTLRLKLAPTKKARLNFDPRLFCFKKMAPTSLLIRHLTANFWLAK